MRHVLFAVTLFVLGFFAPSGNAQVTPSATFGGLQCDTPGVGTVVLTAANAPAPTVRGKFDIVIVADESGSITASEFLELENFVAGLARSFTFGPDAARMGLVMYSTTARLAVPLTSNQATFLNAATNLVQSAGSTCTGCGLALAVSHLQSVKRPDADAIIIVITDGITNVFTTTVEDAVATAETLGYVRVAIGVGSDVSSAELELIASDVPDAQTVLFSSSYVNLTSAVLLHVLGLFSQETPPAALNARVRVVVNPALILSAASSDIGTVSRNGNEVLWTISQVPYGTSALSFIVAAVEGGGATGVPLFTTFTYQAETVASVETASLVIDVPACGPGGPDIDELLTQLQACHAAGLQVQSDLEAAERQIDELESQIAALQSEVGGLQAELQAAQAALTAANALAEAKAALISEVVTSVQQSLRETFNAPGFIIPGATPEEQLGRLLEAILGLNKGRKEGIYRALGGS